MTFINDGNHEHYDHDVNYPWLSIIYIIICAADLPSKKNF